MQNELKILRTKHQLFAVEQMVWCLHDNSENYKLWLEIKRDFSIHGSLHGVCRHFHRKIIHKINGKFIEKRETQWFE